MIDRQFIGHELGAHTVRIESGRLRLFNKVIGQTNPVFLDEDWARAAGYPGLPVPPTFWFSLDLEQDEPFGWLDTLGIDIARVLHGMQDFRYHKPAFAGQMVSLESRIVDLFDKKGGALEFIVKETRVTDEAGALLATLKSTLVVRN